MKKNLVTATGKSIYIGQELGKGGEGTVYEVPASQNWVAKLYNEHHLPDAPKQSKLRFMAATADLDLLNYAAWPKETLHNTINGPVVGFLMPRVTGRTAIHMLYSPAHRKQVYPQAEWSFLLYVARNTAAAFASIHHHGHVIGDVNQGNVLVGNDSKVVLIDTDSYQINENGSTHLCKVGVAHFTAPELQGITSFDRTLKTPNHDNFGLALLIFHLLFGGRHPYSGVPLKLDAGEALEKDIGAFRYAYARDNKRRGFEPPPRSIPIGIVTQSIQEMFNLAFTESGVSGGRPTAQQWVAVLDSMRGQLIKCASSKMHIYPSHLEKCPWCELESRGVFYFLDITLSLTSTVTNGFNLGRAWAAIDAVLPPTAILIPNISSIAVTPTPLPPGIMKESIITFWRAVIVIITVGLLVLIPDAGFLVFGSLLVIWAIGGIGKDERERERTKRMTAIVAAQRVYDQIVSKVRQEASPGVFEKKKQDLAKLRDEYQQLPQREKNEIVNLSVTAEARQKQKYLERIFLDAATITGVGPTKKAALRSFGIETAADVTWQKVINIKGFGEVLTRAVVDWRKSHERRFKFNPQVAVTDSDKSQVRAKIATRRRALEAALNTGAAELQRMRVDIIGKSNKLSPGLQAATLKLAQAQADLKAF
ncbi:MAG: helix-hairpin-helix domain-containing protein [Pseudohongiella sp.]|nr:helix-hairpin-helix domain-containing protein [Pseudohongiella sp.]